MGGFMVNSSINTFCLEISPILKMIGDLLGIFKLALPLILIALCIIDIGKAVISSKTDDIKKNIKACVKKLIVCVAIFFVPTICMVVFGFVNSFKEIKENSGVDFDICYSCMFNSSNEECKKAVEIAESGY